MLDHLILMLSLLGAGHVGLGTVFGSSRWDRSNPHSRLACLRREINDKKDFVIAHNELPCGTKVWIFNPRTGLSTTAEVADRGPKHAYADLSKLVAAAIGHNGKENILLVPVSVPPRKKRHSGEQPLRILPPIEESWEVPESAMLEVPTLSLTHPSLQLSIVDNPFDPLFPAPPPEPAPEPLTEDPGL